MSNMKSTVSPKWMVWRQRLLLIGISFITVIALIATAEWVCQVLHQQDSLIFRYQSYRIMKTPGVKRILLQGDTHSLFGGNVHFSPAGRKVIVGKVAEIILKNQLLN